MKEKLTDLIAPPAKTVLSSASEHYESSTESLKALGTELDLALLLDWDGDCGMRHSEGKDLILISSAPVVPVE
ncbi:unnamed protein product [Caretta caretta]